MRHPEGQNTARKTVMYPVTVLQSPATKCAERNMVYLNKTLAYPDQYDAAVMAASSRWNQHVEGGGGHYGEAKHS